jgi:glycosyltransferase involved in cell wall biosynthesis
MSHITAVVTFHHEGAFAIPALASMSDLVRTAGMGGLTLETLAILDCPDDATRQIVKSCGTWLDDIVEVTFGDLGLSRNEGVRRASGAYVAFLDGDDLWGSEWLSLAHAAAVEAGVGDDVIWHPEHLFYFDENDFKHHSLAMRPNRAARSFHMRGFSSDSILDRRALLIENLWTANAFAKRNVHMKFPYRAADRCSGFGIEDWSWNVETLFAGFRHLVVPGTVHLIRLKQSGSLNARNVSEGLLPFLAPEGFLLMNSKLYG